MITNKAKITSIALLESEVCTLVDCGRFGEAIDAIRQFVECVIFNQRSVGKVFASVDLDRLCQYIGGMAADVSGKYENIKKSGTVILVTELVKAGGHVELIKEIIRLKLFEAPVSILLTDCFARADNEIAAEFLATYGVTVAAAVGATSHERFFWLLNRLRSLEPITLVLLTHNQDSLGIATAYSKIAEKVVYIHHGDHHLSLGAASQDFLHVDPHNIGYFHCKDELGIKNNRYWPLTVNIGLLESRATPFLDEGYLVTCSSGRPEKFDANYYLYDYFKLIPKLLATTKGRHIHIGSLTSNMEEKLHHELMTAGVDLSRFIHIPWVTSVARTLVEYKIDLYVSSFPLGGGKATLEAMAAGVPLLMHQSYRSRFHGGVDLAYPDAWIWRTEAELIDIVSNLTEDDLTRHSVLARSHYEKFHDDQSLIDAVNFSKCQNIAEIPPLRKCTGNALQVFLDETNEIDDALGVNESVIKEIGLQLNECNEQLNLCRRQADQLDEKLRLANSKVVDFDKMVVERNAQIEILTQVLESRNNEVSSLRSSTSWLITKPLRFVSRLLKENRLSVLSVNVAWFKKPVALLKHYYRELTLDQSRLPENFDKNIYLKLNPDLISSGIDPRTHYLLHGHREGRVFALPVLNIQNYHHFNNDRATILVVSHEASRTGAPVLSLNLVQALVERYNIVVLLLGGGPLSDAFRSAGAAVVTSTNLRGNPVLAHFVVCQLCERFDFKFALVNSIESRVVLPPLSECFVPSISLVHEFASYTRPRDAFRDALFWSGEVVFSANVTMANAFAEYPDLGERSAHILPQGRCLLPIAEFSEEQRQKESAHIRRLIRPKGIGEDAVIVLGAGFVQLRKGVDLFIECAARVVAAPDGNRCRFVWIGKGYDPENDVGYSVYLADQIRRAGLEAHVYFLNETTAIETAYEEADLFLLSSRLDPLPNVAIDAMAHGVPVLCFNKTTGIADFLIASGLQNHCVADYLDSTNMAKKILALVGSTTLRKDVGDKCRDASIAYFSMKDYVAQIEVLAQAVCDRSQQEKADTQAILNSGMFRCDYSCAPHMQGQSMESAVRAYVRAWASGIGRRKPFPGFHPGIYLEQHGLATQGADPFADYVRAGQPEGPWNYPVIVAGDIAERDLPQHQRIALHLHVYYPELLPEIITRLARNRICPDLFVSITDENARQLVVSELKNYQGKVVEIQLVPNRGRDIGPFLTLFGPRLVANYDFVGHVHTKMSADVKDAAMGKTWYRFLLENLLGGESGSMADSIMAKMNGDASIGLVFPDDPYVVGMCANHAFADVLAARVGLNKLPEHFVFPVGTMFWARASALVPFVNLRFEWDDYPEEPLPYDGTSLHAIERLFSLSLAINNLQVMTTNVIGLTR